MEVKCLQSGACCISFEVHGVLGYKNGVKPEFEACKHLIKAYKDENGKWHHAKCLLHDTPDYPDECRKYNFPGPNNMCGLGQAVWKSRGVENPQTDLLD